MGNSNKYAEGLRTILYPFNIGATYCGYNFPESSAQDSPGCLSFHFSGDHISNELGDIITGGNGANKIPYNPTSATRRYGWGPSGFYHFSTTIRGLNLGITDLGTNNGRGGPAIFLNTDLLHKRFPNRPFSFRSQGGLNLNAQVINETINIRNISPRPPNLDEIYKGTSKVNNMTQRALDTRALNTITNIQVLDLISEGPIEGLVSGAYIYSTQGKTTGDIGYASATFQPFSTSENNTPAEIRSIFWNDIPLADLQGNKNFQQINYKYTYGEKDNVHTIFNPYVNLYEDRTDYYGRRTDINKIPIETSITKSIGEKLYGGYLKDLPESTSAQYTKVLYPKTYYIYNREISSIDVNIEIQGLFEQMLTGSNAGDIEWKTMEFKFDVYRLMNNMDLVRLDTSKYAPYEPNFYSSDTILIEGRITSPTMFTYHINLRPYAENFPRFEILDNQIGWAIDIVQNTLEGTSSALQSSANIHSITEFYSDRFSYPEVAGVLSRFDARYFNEVPSRSYKVRLLKVKIPENYDPITKTYSGPWNGKFKVAWTDNPAWCFYDLLSNKKYGLGKYINANLIDKWTLYEISQYCDQLVADGNGGLEPRFRCNVYIQNKEEAHKVLNDMASIFRGILYYSAGQIVVSQDSPKEPIYMFNNSNVIDGNFIYSDASKKSRKTVAYVRFNDAFDNYKPAIEYVEDRDSILKYGIRETEIAAFGCTSRTQAKRLGKWILATENQETEIIDFNVGLEGNFVRPGDVVWVYDQNRRLNLYGGRTLELTTGYAVLDIPYNNNNLYALSGINQSFQFQVLTPTYNLKAGTELGDLYMTGFTSITSSGITGINSSFTKRSQVQYVDYNQSIGSYLGSGTGIYSNYIRLNFPKAIKGISSPINSGYNLYQNTVWAIDISTSNYGGVSGGLNIRSLIDNSLNKSYLGYIYEPYLNEPKKYRVLNVVEKEDHSFSVNALEYKDKKYTDVDNMNLLDNLPTRKETPNTPGLNLSGIFRSPSTNSYCSTSPCNGFHFTTNQNGINSVMYNITPPNNSSSVYLYKVYLKSGAFESTTSTNRQYLINTITPEDLSRRGLSSSNWINGTIPYFATPIGTGSYYVRVYAENSIGESSNYIQSIYHLTNQTSVFSVQVSGVNVV
jgi:hypothetical protein